MHSARLSATSDASAWLSAPYDASVDSEYHTRVLEFHVGDVAVTVTVLTLRPRHPRATARKKKISRI